MVDVATSSAAQRRSLVHFLDPREVGAVVGEQVADLDFAAGARFETKTVLCGLVKPLSRLGHEHADLFAKGQRGTGNYDSKDSPR